MNEKQLMKFKEGKGVKKAVKAPMFILRAKGRKDAERSISIAETYIDKVKAKCAAFENREVLMAEEILCESRKEAAVLMSSMRGDKSILDSIPKAREEKSPVDVRANRRNASHRANETERIKRNFERLVSINETIVDVNVCLEQRILKTRHFCSEKLNAYIFGVREVQLEFNNDVLYDNSACEVYQAKHKACDEAIQRAVEIVYEGGNQDEVVQEKKE